MFHREDLFYFSVPEACPANTTHRQQGPQKSHSQGYLRRQARAVETRPYTRDAKKGAHRQKPRNRLPHRARGPPQERYARLPGEKLVPR